MSTYRAVQLKGKGGLDQLVEVTLPREAPSAGELRVRVRATGVGYTDVIMRRGYYPYRPAFPFVPGYEVVGVVDAVGAGVEGFAVGDRVAALTVYGGYAEELTRAAKEFVKVPAGLDDAAVAAVILNYVTAYQMIHRVAKLERGATALVTGASGGVGLALLELLRDTGVRVVGAASGKNHALVQAEGATPIEGRAAPVDAATLALFPQGVDAAFDGIGGATTGQCVRATRRGGIVVGYGFTGVMESNLGTMRGALALFVGARLRGRRSAFYGITQWYRDDPTPFREDLPQVLRLLAEGKIRPRIVARLGLLEGARAQRMLEEGGVAGKLVLVAG
jgi:NADPH:quinone reductase-like Zn-dependent oxidoreductase